MYEERVQVLEWEHLGGACQRQSGSEGTQSEVEKCQVAFLDRVSEWDL